MRTRKRSASPSSLGVKSPARLTDAPSFCVLRRSLLSLAARSRASGPWTAIWLTARPRPGGVSNHCRSSRWRWDIAFGLRGGKRFAGGYFVLSYVLMGHDFIVVPLELGFFQMNSWALHLQVEVTHPGSHPTGGGGLSAASRPLPPGGCSSSCASPTCRTSCDQKCQPGSQRKANRAFHRILLRSLGSNPPPILTRPVSMYPLIIPKLRQKYTRMQN